MRVITLLAAATVFGAIAPILTAPAEAQPANAPDQRPAFSGQTCAPKPERATAVTITPVVEGLQNSWSLEFLPDGRMLTSEKAGGMRIVSTEGRVGPPIAGVPRVDSRGQGGLLDLALSPTFKTDRLIYASFSEPREGGRNGTSVARARLVEEGGGARLDDLRMIFRQEPSWTNNLHFGSRLVFAPDGKLFVTAGERSDSATRGQAQQLGSGLGKVFRINPDGSAPPDNPFVGRAGALATIWSYGHRNVQSAALDEQGRLWTVEHGPRGGDELNRPQAGLNYGWPEVTYGLEYSGAKVGAGLTSREGTEQPVYYWDPVIAPSGMAIYKGAAFPGWRGAILVGGLVSEGLVVLRMEGDRVASEERIPLGARVRDVKSGPDGAVYVLTERDRGGSRILKIAPSR